MVLGITLAQVIPYGMPQYARHELSFVFLIPLCVPFIFDGIVVKHQFVETYMQLRILIPYPRHFSNCLKYCAMS